MKRNLIAALSVCAITVIIGALILVFKKDSIIKPDTALTNTSNVQLKFGEKEYKIDSSSFRQGSVSLLSGFEIGEEWTGGIEFDEVIYWQGNSSLLITSKDNERKDVHMTKSINLDSVRNFKLAVYLQDNTQDIDTFRVYFSDRNKYSYFSYAVRNLNKGWNFITIPKEKFTSTVITSAPKKTSTQEAGLLQGNLSWDKIERVGFDFASRPNSEVILNVDELKGLEMEDYLESWLTNNSSFLDLTVSEDKILIQGKNYGAANALIKKVSGVSDFTFQAKILPQRSNARSGLFVRGDFRTGFGYYLLVDGINGSRWQIMKIGQNEGKTATNVLKNGIINNFLVEKNKPLWLRGVLKGTNIKYYLSTDNKSYTLIGEINDSEHKEGGVGIAVLDAGMSLFDEIEFHQ